MSYCVLIQDKIINEGDIISISTIEGMGMGEIQLKVSNIDPESQNIAVKMDEYRSEIEIPISMWEGASIIENEKLTDPNISFKLNHTHHDGPNDGQ